MCTIYGILLYFARFCCKLVFCKLRCFVAKSVFVRFTRGFTCGEKMTNMRYASDKCKRCGSWGGGWSGVYNIWGEKVKVQALEKHWRNVPLNWWKLEQLLTELYRIASDVEMDSVSGEMTLLLHRSASDEEWVRWRVVWRVEYTIYNWCEKSESALVVKELGQFSIKLMRVGAITEASEGRTDCTEVMPPVR